jgi:hypothetical protein
MAGLRAPWEAAMGLAGEEARGKGRGKGQGGGREGGVPWGGCSPLFGPCLCAEREEEVEERRKRKEKKKRKEKNGKLLNLKILGEKNKSKFMDLI